MHYLPWHVRRKQRGFIINPYVFGVGDPDFASVVMLLHMDDLADSYTDIITSPSRTWARRGTTTVSSSTEKKYGAGALAISSTGPGGITTTTGAWHQTGTSDFCYEWWAYLTSYTNAGSNNGFHVSQYNGSYGLVLQVQTDGKPNFLNSTQVNTYDINITGASAVGLNQWNHYAFVRDGSNYYGYLNGVSFGTDTGGASSVLTTNNPFDLGGSWIVDTLVLPGYMDDFRLTIGVPRYPGGTTFTPPTAAFPDS